MPAAFTTAVLLCLLLVAVTTDLRSRRIPNTLVLTGMLLALAAHALSLAADLPALAGDRWWAPLTGLAVGLIALLPLYLLRATGAGDVKLLAMVGAFVGVPTIWSAALYTLLAGGLLSLALMFGRGVTARTVDNIRCLLTDWALRLHTGRGAALAPLDTTAARLPYALAISAGTVIALLQSP